MTCLSVWASSEPHVATRNELHLVKASFYDSFVPRACTISSSPSLVSSLLSRLCSTAFCLRRLGSSPLRSAAHPRAGTFWHVPRPSALAARLR